MSALRETIEDILLKTGKHNQEECSELADLIIKDLPKQSGPVWIKASERLPERNKHVALKYGNQFYGAFYNDEHKMIYSLLTHHYWSTSDRDLIGKIYWLDESETAPAPGMPILKEPILTDEDMKDWEADQKGLRGQKLTPEQIDERKEAINWYRNPDKTENK